MSKRPLPCLLCGKELLAVCPPDVDPDQSQPNDAVQCVAVGNYGSKYFDSLFGRIRDFNICDDCFVRIPDERMRERPAESYEALVQQLAARGITSGGDDPTANVYRGAGSPLPPEPREEVQE